MITLTLKCIRCKGEKTEKFDGYVGLKEYVLEDMGNVVNERRQYTCRGCLSEWEEWQREMEAETKRKKQEFWIG